MKQNLRTGNGARHRTAWRGWFGGLVLGVMVAGCSAGLSRQEESSAQHYAAQKAAKGDDLKRLEASIDAPVLEGDRYTIRGSVQVELADSPTHQLGLEAAQQIVRGDGDLTVTIEDATNGTTTHFSSDEEAGSLEIRAAGEPVKVTHLEDDTVAVDGVVYADDDAASEATADHPKLGDLSSEALVGYSEAMVQVMSAESSDDEASETSTDRAGTRKQCQTALTGLLTDCRRTAKRDPSRPYNKCACQARNFLITWANCKYISNKGC